MATRSIPALLRGTLLVASGLVVLLARRQVALNRAYLELTAKAGASISRLRSADLPDQDPRRRFRHRRRLRRHRRPAARLRLHHHLPLLSGHLAGLGGPGRVDSRRPAPRWGDWPWAGLAPTGPGLRRRARSDLPGGHLPRLEDRPARPGPRRAPDPGPEPLGRGRLCPHRPARARARPRLGLRRPPRRLRSVGPAAHRLGGRTFPTPSDSFRGHPAVTTSGRGGACRLSSQDDIMSRSVKKIGGWGFGLAVAGALAFGGLLAVAKPANAMSCADDGVELAGIPAVLQRLLGRVLRAASHTRAGPVHAAGLLHLLLLRRRRGSATRRAPRAREAGA